jgi:hypothetical protein
MALDLSNILDTSGASVSVLSITGKATDAAAAAGYSAFISSVTGKAPKVTRSQTPGHAKLLLTDDQSALLQAWFDDQIIGSFKKDPDKTLEIDFGPALKPVVFRYLFILIGLGLISGVILTKILK